jgi:hypothetical protein
MVDAEVDSQPELLNSAIIKELLDYQDEKQVMKDRSRTVLKLNTSKSIGHHSASKLENQIKQMEYDVISEK